jgi:site-specific recombinase XerD
VKTDKNQSLEELVKEFLEYLEVERNLSRLTIRNYAIYLRRLTMWLADEFPELDTVEKLDLKTVRAYRLFLSRLVDDTGKPLKKITQNYYIITLRSFLKWLIKNDYKVLAPEKIELPKQDSRSLKFLTADQVNYLLAQPYLSTEIDLRDKAILEVLFSTGLRVSELVSLDCEQINFKTREFGIIGKGRRHRIVFLSPRAVKWLLRYLEERTDDYSPLFIRYSRGEDREKDGEKMRLTPRSVQRIVKKYVKRAKLSVDATTHTLRHSFATDLLTHGADLRSVQELLGHKNVATTQVYTHVTNARLRSVHEKFHGKEAED